MKKLFLILAGILTVWGGNVFALTLECTEESKTIPSNVRHGFLLAIK